MRLKARVIRLMCQRISRTMWNGSESQRAASPGHIRHCITVKLLFSHPTPPHTHTHIPTPFSQTQTQLSLARPSLWTGHIEVTLFMKWIMMSLEEFVHIAATTSISVATPSDAGTDHAVHTVMVSGILKLYQSWRTLWTSASKKGSECQDLRMYASSVCVCAQYVTSVHSDHKGLGR